MSSKNEIKGFETPEFRWLSNFYPCTITYEGITYPSSEHAYQAAKSEYTGDRLAVARCSTPGQAKRMGRKIKIRSDWDKVKRGVMKDILRIKFSLPGLQKCLLATGNAYLEETNHWGDTYWGVYRDVGLNQLGEILMEIREELRNK